MKRGRKLSLENGSKKVVVSNSKVSTGNYEEESSETAVRRLTIENMIACGEKR